MPLSKPQPEKAPVSTTSAHFIGPTKSILKPSPAQTPVQTPARVASPAPPEGAGARRAHFPPPGQEPTARYSGVDYDRSPIVVLPNVCALPERGCPGKTYFQDERAIRVSSASSSITNSAARAGNHAHPAKLLKKAPRPSPPPLASVPSSVPPALTHSDTTSSDDYDSDETCSRPIFPLSEPETVFSTGPEHERPRKTSASSERTIGPTLRGKGTGRRAWNPTSKSSEDDCLGGF